MADTFQNITLTRNTWTDLYSLTSIAVGSQLIIETISSGSLKMYRGATPPVNADNVENGYFTAMAGNRRISNVSGDTGLWVLSESSGAVINVSLGGVNDVNIISPIETNTRGSKGLAVFIQDQTTDPLDLFFLQKKVEGLTLGANTVVGERTLTLSAGHGLTTANSAGHIIDLTRSPDGDFYRGEILTITGDVVEVAPPLSDNYQIATTGIYTGNSNMCGDSATGVAIDGSITPVVFSLDPRPSQSGDITAITLATTSPNFSDLTTFGGAPILVAGMTLRINRGNGTYKNIFTYRSNFDVAVQGNDLKTFDPKTGNTTKGTSAKIAFAGQHNHGVAIRLDGALNEKLEVIIYELMNNTSTGNITVKFLAEGSELQR